MFLFLILLGTAGYCFFYWQEALWQITIFAFGFEISFSLLLLVFIGICFYFLIKLLNWPFKIIDKLKEKWHLKKENQKNEYIEKIILCALTADNDLKKEIKKHMNEFKENAVLYKLLATISLKKPSEKEYSELLFNPQTKLLGLTLLLQYYILHKNETLKNAIITQILADYPKSNLAELLKTLIKDKK